MTIIQELLKATFSEMNNTVLPQNVLKIWLPDVTDSVMFKLFKESPSDCRDEDDDVLLEDSDDGRAGFPVFPVSAFKRSFSAFNISISFCIQKKSAQEVILSENHWGWLFWCLLFACRN